MLHSRPLDWEVVESHAVAPVQVLFKDDGVEIHQIAPNAVSGSYTFDMHSPSRTSPPASPPPKSTAAQAAQAARPRPVSDPGTDTTEGAGTTSYPPKKLHRKSRSAAASPAGARGASNPFNFGILRRMTPPSIAQEPAAGDAPEPRPERRRSLGTAFSFLQPRHARDRLVSPPSPSSTKSGASTSGSEDGAPAEFGSQGAGPAAQREIRRAAQAEAAARRHSAGSYSPSARSTPASVPRRHPATAAPAAHPSYDKAQTKKVLKHARAELMKEVGKAGYNVLVVEGWELTVLRQSERYRIKVVYHARPAIAQSDLMGGEGIRVPRRPPYLSVLDD